MSTFVSMWVDRLHEAKVISHAAVTLDVFGVDGFFDVSDFSARFLHSIPSLSHYVVLVVTI
ncbi:hypothetical protein KUV86_14410 [Halomonas sp. DP8Y7-3]|uniref:hypothetical protein n=1 Tax=Halomonas sp. DP8Y7-3 TaxID=2859079 RepID=UPI001C93EAEC|nr:hypothetical protein [Halomonas sp. DP8Y7-3]MBY5930300.1 hypothetical protein [Halomonas sp. DP8Y7-3]